MSSSQAPTDHSDEQLARDMQLAYELQAREEQRSRHRNRSSHNNTLSDGFNYHSLNSSHMLFVSCLVDDRVPIELLVDTGAGTSAISMKMVRTLGLESKLNRSIGGIANGVGSANIVGVLENVGCKMGHVEFRLFFMVLESDLPCCILGLDQMRRFQCQVDLASNVLIFGGKDGVSVPFLSATEAQMASMKMMGAGSQEGSAVLESVGDVFRSMFGRR